MIRPKRLEWELDGEELFWRAETSFASYVIACESGYFFAMMPISRRYKTIEAAKAACQAHYEAAWIAGGEEVEDHEKNKLFNALQDERGLVDRWIEATGYRDPTTYKNRELPDYS